MKPLHIRAELLRKGITGHAIAQQLGLTDATVSDVIHGRGKSLRVAREISRVVDIPVEQLWPGAYDSRLAA